MATTLKNERKEELIKRLQTINRGDSWLNAIGIESGKRQQNIAREDYQKFLKKQQESEDMFKRFTNLLNT